MIPLPYIPEICVWELTLQCNMRCIHCGSRAGKSRKNELRLEEALNVADQLVEMGCRKVTFIGGEVFFYDDWEKIARQLTDKGVVVNIITNGYRFNPEHIRQIQHAGLTNVAFSVDGMAQNHNWIRNREKSFQHVLQACDRLRKENIALAVVTVLMDNNIGDLETLYQLLLEEGVRVWQLQVANPMGNMAQRKDMLLNPAKIPEVTTFIRTKRQEKRMSIYAGDNIGYYDENEPFIRGLPGTQNPWQGCQAGLRVVGIDSVGNVKGCESIYSDKFIEGNLRETSLERIWFKENAFAYNRNFDTSLLTGNCAGCDKGAICRGGCRGACYFNKGTFFENAYCQYNIQQTSGS